jgi:hypothetical protein
MEWKDLRIQPAVFNIAAIIFLVCGVVSFSYCSIFQHKAGVAYAVKNYNQQFWTKVPDRKSDPANDSVINVQKKILLKENFKSLKDHYSDVSKDLNVSIQNLIAILTVGLLLLFFENIIPKNGISVPLISVTIPVKLIYFIVIFGMLYLWVHIGLLTNDANDCRLSLVTLINNIETVGGDKVAYKYSLGNVLGDSGMIDNMCAYYYKIFEDKSITTNLLSAFGLFGIYGSLFGLSMGVCLATVFEFVKREKINTGSYLVLFFFAVLLYGLSTIVVCTKFPHMTAWLGWWWIVCGSFMLFWTVKQKNNGNQPEPNDDFIDD